MKINEAINRAKAELNTTEFPANSNNVKYNTWYYGKMVQGAAYPWCAAFISYIFRDSPSLVKKTASCADMLTWFEVNNRIVKEPQPGDIIFFKFSTNSRRTNHVGLVVDVTSTVIKTIEGNTSATSNDNGGSVMMRSRKRNSRNIVAYARPAYEDLGHYHPILRRGAKGDAVEFLQEMLNVKDIRVTVDGDFGPATEIAVKTFQKANGLTDDGIVGPKTWEKLCS